MKNNLNKRAAGSHSRTVPVTGGYDAMLDELSQLLESSRRSAARHVNSIMTATYWEMGRRIVLFEQRGKERAGYGEEIIASLAAGLTGRFGRGFGVSQLKMIRQFHLLYRDPKIRQSVIGEFRQALPDTLPTEIRQSAFAKSGTDSQKGQSAIGQLHDL